MASQWSSKPEAKLRHAPNNSPPPASKKQPLAAAARVLPFQRLTPVRGSSPHEHLARQQEATMCLAALKPLAPSPMLSQEAHDKAPAVSLALGTSPLLSVTTADTHRVSLVSWVRCQPCT
ncbi:hypothetical protein B0H14DRAFT_3487746 [Mycena olivaceomarginata]|nr:hypothetical protein B0H14DRAFT_3487746 [Mycena olivaceomarginata]